MKILYDLMATQPSGGSKFHGGGLYGEVVFLALLDKSKDVDIFCVYNSKEYINPLLLEKCNEAGIPIFDINSKSLENIIEENYINVFYSPIPMPYSKLCVDNCLFVGTIHGLRSLEMYIEKTAWKYAFTLKLKIVFSIKFVFQKYLQKRGVYKIFDSLFKNKQFRFITVSYHSKYSILNFYPSVKENSIEVFYSPLLEQVESQNIALPSLPQNIESKKYFLLTNGDRWIKNNIRGVLALDKLFTEKPCLDFKVVITGVDKAKIYTRRIQNKDKFIFMKYIDRDMLNTLHKEAYAFVYPSLNEGFGYPPLESMKYGVPSVVSGISSIPEICGESVLYFSPYSIDEIKNRILQILDKNIYLDYSHKAMERYKQISEKQKKDLYSLINYIITIR